MFSLKFSFPLSLKKHVFSFIFSNLLNISIYKTGKGEEKDSPHELIHGSLRAKHRVVRGCDVSPARHASERRAGGGSVGTWLRVPPASSLRRRFRGAGQAVS